MAVAWLFSTQLSFAQEIQEIPPSATSPAPAPWNLHLVMTEAFINRFIARDEVQPGPVQDQFEDTPIAGQQVTATRLRFDLQPSATVGRGLFVLEGETSSQTSGFSPQAIVNSVGCQKFRATKEILFDGYQLATRHPVVAARAENLNVGAVTKFTGRPLGPFVEHVVLTAAQHRQPAAEAFARRRVIERVYPRFNREIDDRLGQGNRFLKETLQKRLQTARLMPGRLSVRSTDAHLHFAASVAVPLDVAAVEPAPERLVGRYGVSLYLHQSLFQGVMEHANLAGTTTSSQELIRLLRLTGLAKDEPSGPLATVDVEIELAEVDPLRIEIGDDETRVTLRAKFKAVGQELVPPMEIAIPCRLRQEEHDWVVQIGDVRVRALDGPSDGTSIAEVTVKKLVQTSLPRLSFPRQFPAEFTPDGRTPPQITSVRSGNGWLVIGID